MCYFSLVSFSAGEAHAERNERGHHFLSVALDLLLGSVLICAIRTRGEGPGSAAEGLVPAHFTPRKVGNTLTVTFIKWLCITGR